MIKRDDASASAVAARYGLKCERVLEDVTATPQTDYYNNGNRLLDNLFGAELHYCQEGEGWLDNADARVVELKGRDASHT